MRISDNRYSRDRQRYDLALRFIQHEARTSTIRLWTGLTDDRIRKLYRSYIADEGHSTITRHRGKSPQHIGFFTRTPHMRQETAVLASVCFLLGAVSGDGKARAAQTAAGLIRAESICEAFEVYQHLVPDPRISFEHAVFLVKALTNGAELRAELCTGCTGLIIVDQFATNNRRCLACEESRQGRLPLEQ
jgi:Flagellar transcriptional activator (FlhC)